MATPGWQRRWLESFTATQTMTMLTPTEDLVMDGWTDLAHRIRERLSTLPADQFTPDGLKAALEDADFEKMSEIRARVDSIVDDPETAQNLKAWYWQLCKRPCFHDEYLQAYNEPNTYLVDTSGMGVERITENGVVVAGVEYELDCIIYASGFEVGTSHTRRAGYDMVGRDGLKLSEYWEGGMRSLHGTHVHGFPNAFFVQIAQGANLISNVPHNFTEAGQTVAMIVRHALDGGYHEVEVTAEAEQAWMDLLRSGPRIGIIGSPDCTPGYYNNEGQPLNARARFGMAGYPLGPVAYFDFIDQWRNSGGFEGLEFRTR
jgi:cyclohexanone monooxygenase